MLSSSMSSDDLQDKRWVLGSQWGLAPYQQGLDKISAAMLQIPTCCMGTEILGVVVLMRPNIT